MSGSAGSVFYKTSSSSSLGSSSQSSLLMKSCLSHSTSALFDVIKDSKDSKTPTFKSSKRVGFKSANSLFNRLPQNSSTVCFDRHSPTSPVRRQYSNSIFNIIETNNKESEKIVKYYNKMPLNSNESDIIVSKTVRNELEAKPWAARGRSADMSSQNRLLIRGGRCVNDDNIFDADIYVEEGVIRQIGAHLTVPGGVKVIEAKGHYVIPGGVDAHTHLQLPFMGTRTIDDFYSGTKAALAGGTTFVIDFAIPDCDNRSLLDAYEKWRQWADERVCCDYGLHVAVTDWKGGQTEQEMATLVKEKGINSFKCFMAYKNTFMINDSQLISVFNTCRDIGALAQVHAENGDIIDSNTKRLLKLGITGPEGHLQSRPEEVEAEATNRAIVLANQTNCPLYVVHVMSKMAADVIAESRNRGIVVFGEVLAAGIGTDGSHHFNKCWRHAAAHVMSPPLRADKTTSEHLLNLLSSGQLQTIGSDHCVFSADQKALGSKDFSKIPNGVNGVEERLMILWEKGVRTGKLDPSQFVAVTSTNAAKIFNVYPRKGRIAVGSDADLVVWGHKPKVIKAESHHSSVDFNIFEGISVSFGPLVVVSSGRVVLDEDGLRVSQGSGRFIPCPPFAPFVYNNIRERDRIGPVFCDRTGAEAKKAVTESTNGIKASVAPILASEPVIIPTHITGHESIGQNDGFFRAPTRSGVRNLQDSSFSLSGSQFDDDKQGKTAIRVHNPPGGRSSGIW